MIRDFGESVDEEKGLGSVDAIVVWLVARFDMLGFGGVENLQGLRHVVRKAEIW